MFLAMERVCQIFILGCCYQRLFDSKVQHPLFAACEDLLALQLPRDVKTLDCQIMRILPHLMTTTTVR